MNIETILMVVIPLVSYVFGELAKVFGWVKKKYLPLQTIAIGLVGGLLYYLILDNSSFISAVIIAFSSLIACGTYDLAQTKKEDDK